MPTFFDKIYNELFKKNSTPEFNGKKFLLKEQYAMGDQMKKEYENWREEEDSKRLYSLIVEEILSEFRIPKPDFQRYSVYKSTQSNGFYVLCENFLDTKTSVFLMERIKEGILDLNYYQNHSSKEVYEERNNIKEKLVYYFKYKVKNYELPLDQSYGNIHLEMLSINDKPDYIKLMANIYSDRNYKDALEFEDLLQDLNT